MQSSGEHAMSKQRTFGDLAWDGKKKVTRREQFLAEMDAVVPWAEFVRLVSPVYPKGERGRPVMPLAMMLRIYFVQQWFNLSDPAAEDALYDSESIRRFVGVDLSDDAVPDESTILRFRHLLEQHELTAAMFAAVRAMLEQKGILLKGGTIVDATILHAPTSTKNATGTRDPEMKQTRKGNQWYFGMKAHVGTDRRGLVHSLVTTDAADADINHVVDLLHGDERELYGDSAYSAAWLAESCRANGIRYRVNRRGKLSARERRWNQSRSRHRARGEHAFHVVKRLWGFTKVRYRGLAKNTTRLFTMFALANLYLARRRLRPA
jgi:IS5 family transposase